MSEKETNPEENPIRLPYEVRRKLGILRSTLVDQVAKIEILIDKTETIAKIYKLIDRKIKAKEKALETKEDIAKFQEFIQNLSNRIAPFMPMYITKIVQVEGLLDRLEQLV